MRFKLFYCHWSLIVEGWASCFSRTKFHAVLCAFASWFQRPTLFRRGLKLPHLQKNTQLPTFKWERPSVLGKMFTKNATRRHAERKDMRKEHGKHIIVPSVTGLKVGQL